MNYIELVNGEIRINADRIDYMREVKQNDGSVYTAIYVGGRPEPIKVRQSIEEVTHLIESAHRADIDLTAKIDANVRR